MRDMVEIGMGRTTRRTYELGDINIVLESLTPNTTRMKVTARQNGGFLTDSATATEVILQTEKLVGPS